MELNEDIQIVRDNREVFLSWWNAKKDTPDCYAFNIHTLEGLQPVLDRLSKLFGIEVVVKYRKP